MGVAGGSVSFICAASGSPLPNITWMKDGERIEYDGEQVSIRIDQDDTSVSTTLRLTDLSLADEGGYLCIASNNLASLQQTVSNQANLTVQCKWRQDHLNRRE